MRKKFHQSLLDSILTLDTKGVPSNADKHQKTSIDVARNIYDLIGGGPLGDFARQAGQSAGSLFENVCEEFLRNTYFAMSHLRPGVWEIEKISSRKGLVIAKFEQYEHLVDLDTLSKSNIALAAAIGNDYTISPDIVVLRLPEDESMINQHDNLASEHVAKKSPIRAINNQTPLLHACISCKWTLRSDRAQNARSEALNLIRNRKGRTPHIVVITAEPSPSRIASIALGTGDIDCVYHFALDELIASVNDTSNDEAIYLLDTMVHGKRLKDIADLPFDLVI